jgi:opacity protein-like surface antigen
MKKITFFLTSILSSGIIFPAQADSYNYRPYIGVDYIYNQTNARGFSPHYSAGGLHIGSTYSPYFATELFYNASDSDKLLNQGQKIKTSYQSYGLDLLAMLPLGCEKRFSLLATTGIGEYIVRQKPTFQKHQTEHGWGYRFGGGIQYAWSKNWQTRFLTRYVNFDQLSGYNHAVEYNLSLEYHF